MHSEFVDIITIINIVIIIIFFIIMGTYAPTTGRKIGSLRDRQEMQRRSGWTLTWLATWGACPRSQAGTACPSGRSTFVCSVVDGAGPRRAAGKTIYLAQY